MNAHRAVAMPFLTDRQTDCMRLVRKGYTSKQIGRELGISPRTVDQHIAAVIERLQVNNRLAAVKRLQELEEKSKRESDFNTGLVDLNSEYFAGLYSKAVEEQQPADRSIFPPLGGHPNFCTKKLRIQWIMRIGILSMMLGCLVVLSIFGLSDLASGIDA